jgi:hypothetical protein
MAERDVMVAAGRVLTAPLDTTRPDETIPFDTIPTGYTRLGELSQSIKITYEKTVLDIVSQNALGKIGQRVTNEILTVETGINEFLLSNLRDAWGGTFTDNVTWEELKGGGDICIPTVEWLLEFPYHDVTCGGTILPLRLMFRGEAEKGGGTIEFGKENQTEIPLMISASHDTSKPIGEQLYEWQKVLS